MKVFSRIIINVEDSTPPEIAVRCVAQVVGEGRVSSSHEPNDCYCFATVFTGGMGKGTAVYAVRRKSGTDVFYVRKDSRENL